MTNWHTHTNTHWQIDKASDNVHAQAANQLGIIKCILKQFVGIKFGTTQRVSETGAPRGNCCCVSSAEGERDRERAMGWLRGRPSSVATASAATAAGG